MSQASPWTVERCKHVLHLHFCAVDSLKVSFVTSIGTGPNFQRKTQTFETSLQWKSGGFHGIKITDDFVYCCSTRRDEPQLVEFIHIPTGKRLCAFLRVSILRCRHDTSFTMWSVGRTFLWRGIRGTQNRVRGDFALFHPDSLLQSYRSV